MEIVRPTVEQIATILADHKKWLSGESDGKRAVLSGAVLSGAVLSGAVLSGADLRNADLRNAVLRNADLRNAVNGELAFAMTEILPRGGEVLGWKKCRKGVLVSLRIPPAAKRSNATGRKCRAECAEIVSVENADGAPCEVGVSIHDSGTEYRAGEVVKCHQWGADRWVECSGGIHFYLTKEEAIAHS